MKANLGKLKQNGFQAAERGLALQHAIAAHPHLIREGGQKVSMSICVKTGRFVPATCERLGVLCDCCCEGRQGELTKYGSGISAWFKLIKLLVGLFGILSLLAIPAVLVVGQSASLNSILPTATSALAEVSIKGVNGNFTVAATMCRALEAVELLSSNDKCSMSASQTVRLLVALEFVTAIVILAAYMWLSRFIRAEDRAVSAVHIGASAFTSYFPWVPPETQENALQLKAFIKACLKHNDGYDHEIREISLIRSNPAAMSKLSRLRKLGLRVQRLKAKHALLRWQRGDKWKNGDLSQYDKHAANSSLSFRDDPDYTLGSNSTPNTVVCRRKVSVQHELNKLDEQLQRIAKQHEKQRATVLASSTSANTTTQGAFVTFESLASNEAALHIFAPSLQPDCCRQRHLRMEFITKGERQYRVPTARTAPPPDVVNWPSFSVPRKVVVLRRAAAILATSVVVAASFALTIAVSTVQKNLQPAESFCQTGGSTIGVRLLTSSGLLRAEQSSGALRGSQTAQTSNETSSGCSACNDQQWHTLTVPELQQRLDSRQCIDDVCKALLIASAKSHDAQTALFKKQGTCSDWLSTYGTLNALLVMSSLTSVVLNYAIIMGMDRLIAWEAHKSADSANMAYSQRLQIMQFINMVGVPVLVYAAIRLPPAFNPLQGVTFVDITPDWLAVVGAALVFTTILNAFTQHFKLLLKGLRLHCRRKAVAARCQDDMNRRFVGPKWKPAKRIAQLMNTCAICIILGPSMPILVFVGFVAMVVFYWVEVIAFVHILRAPPRYNSSTVRLSQTLFAMVVMRLCFAIWVFGSPYIFDTPPAEPAEGSAFAGVCQLAISLSGGQRANDGIESGTGFVSVSNVWAGLVLRTCNPSLVPLWALLLTVLSATATAAMMRIVESSMMTCCRVASCGLCCAAYEPPRPHKQHLYLSTFEELSCPGNGGEPPVVDGLLTYNILHHPVYKEQFGYDANFLAGLDASGQPLREKGWRPSSLQDLAYMQGTQQGTTAPGDTAEAASAAASAFALQIRAVPQRVLSGSISFRPKVDPPVAAIDRDSDSA